MSAHDHEPEGEHAAEALDAHDDHGEAPPPEPASPAWLPLLGGALFLAGLLLFLLMGSSDPNDSAEPAASAEAPTEPAPAARVPSGLARPRRIPSLTPPPGRDAQAPGAAPAAPLGH